MVLKDETQSGDLSNLGTNTHRTYKPFHEGNRACEVGDFLHNSARTRLHKGGGFAVGGK